MPNRVLASGPTGHPNFRVKCYWDKDPSWWLVSLKTRREYPLPVYNETTVNQKILELATEVPLTRLEQIEQAIELNESPSRSDFEWLFNLVKEAGLGK